MESHKFSLLTSDPTSSSVSIWDSVSGANLQHFEGYKIATDGLENVDDFIIGCTADKKFLQIYKINSEKTNKIICLPVIGKCVTYSKRYNILACFLSSEIYLWHPESGILLAILSNIHNSAGCQLIFDDTNNLISVDESGLIVVWKIDLSQSTNKALWFSRPMGNRKLKIRVINSDNSIFVSSFDNTICVVSLSSGELVLHERILPEPQLRIRSLVNYKTLMFIGCTEGVVYSFNTVSDEWNMLYLCRGDDKGDVTHLAITPCFSMLYCVLSSKYVYRIDLSDNDLTATNKSCVTLPSIINNFLLIPQSADEIITKIAAALSSSSSNNTKLFIKKLEYKMTEINDKKREEPQTQASNNVEVFCETHDPDNELVVTRNDLLSSLDSEINSIYDSILSNEVDNINARSSISTIGDSCGGSIVISKDRNMN